MRRAITRQVAATINDCQLVELERNPIDYARARLQHRAYCSLLARLGWNVTDLPADEALPDSVFVEDTAVVFDECAIITRPGAESRRDEIAPIAAELGKYKELYTLDSPATLDGGDVIVQGRRVWIGQTTRTNDAAIEQVQNIVEQFDYKVVGVSVSGCLHLKSAATAVAEHHIALNTAWIDPGVFTGCELVETPVDEPSSANILDLGDSVVVAAAFPKMREKLTALGFESHTLEADELAKAEGALTCCSILIG